VQLGPADRPGPQPGRRHASHPAACPKAAVACRLEMPGDLELLGCCCPPRARRQRRRRPRAVASADRPTNAFAADHRRLPAHNDLRVRLIELAWREGVTLVTRPSPHHRTRAAEALTHPEGILKVQRER
jgi:hypothetical protein